MLKNRSRYTFSRYDVRRDKKFSMLDKSSLEIELEIFYYSECFIRGKIVHFVEIVNFFYISFIPVENNFNTFHVS